MNKHTPGPWYLSRIMGNIYIISNPNEIDSAIKNSQLAHVRKEADAHIIAAAPELFKELKRDVTNPANHEFNCQYRTYGEIKPCNCKMMSKVALVLKAEGESNG